MAQRQRSRLQSERLSVQIALGSLCFSIAVAPLFFRKPMKKIGLSIPKKQIKRNVNRAFEEDDHDDEDYQSQISRPPQHSNHTHHNHIIKDMHQKALTEDAQIFDYDAAHDEIEAARAEERRIIRGEPRKARYIGQMKEQAEVRQVEHDQIQTQKMEKELEREGIKKEDLVQYVTESYKKQKLAIGDKAEAEVPDEAEMFQKIGDNITSIEDLEEQWRRQNEFEEMLDREKWDQLKRIFERTTTDTEIEEARQRYHKRKIIF
jgi:coiled-coil domain-containing protein 55